jgi:hypothetical protein
VMPWLYKVWKAGATTPPAKSSSLEARPLRVPGELTQGKRYPMIRLASRLVAAPCRLPLTDVDGLFRVGAQSLHGL